MKELEKILKALANRRRLGILKYLKRNKEATVSDIAEEIDLSIKSTSKHLAILFSFDILEKTQRNVQVFYRLAQDQSSVVRHIFTLI